VKSSGRRDDVPKFTLLSSVATAWSHHGSACHVQVGQDKGRNGDSARDNVHVWSRLPVDQRDQYVCVVFGSEPVTCAYLH
jgi:hypothetical protein